MPRDDTGSRGRFRRPPGSLRAIGAGAVIAAFVVALVVACGGESPPSTSSPALPTSWSEINRAAQGQTVRWWMYGGDARINAFVKDRVAPAAARLGVRLEQVPVEDTADAVQRVLSEREAGRDSGGAVDLIWINGENFALGKDQGLWLRDWAGRLPNAKFLDLAAPANTTDFGVPVDGQESPWSRAAFVFAVDSAKVPSPPHTLRELLAYARAHPGRFTYPAPPDFTGSAFVRLVVQEFGEDQGLRILRDLRSAMYEGGASLPKSEAELNRLVGDGQVDIAMSYDPGFVLTGIQSGTLPRTTRPFALDRTLVNTSFVTIPANAAHPEAAAVVADLLLSPQLQAEKADPEVLGIPTVLDPARLDAAGRRAFARAAASPYLLGPEELGRPLTELPASEVTRLERRWRQVVLG